MANVNVFADKKKAGQKQYAPDLSGQCKCFCRQKKKSQKQYAPDLSMWGHKNGQVKYIIFVLQPSECCGKTVL